MNSERLSRTFITLCEIDSPSRGEAQLAGYLRAVFNELGADSIFEDDSRAATGSDTGNLLIRFAGGLHHSPPVCFNCHLDVINPCLGIKVRKVNDVFFSSGDTVLGADDKAGIALLLETIASLREQGIPFAPLEILLTTCEEIGLLGAKSFDGRHLRSVYGYALDSTGVDTVVTGAPASHAVVAEIRGLAAHAGLRPRYGINAIQIAAQAIARLPMGQLDDVSTANIGIIAGGTATNIVPDLVQVNGEIRSHDPARLRSYLDLYHQIFLQAVEDWNVPQHLTGATPSLRFQSPLQYPALQLADDSLPLVRARQAAAALDRDLTFHRAGGGSDANFLNAAGLPCAILGIGMENVHSTSETISLADMLRTAELVHSLLTC